MKILQEIKYDIGKKYKKLYLYHHDNPFCQAASLEKTRFYL